jgi:flagellar protein FliJ
MTMPEFRFRLATLLQLRETARDQCRAALAEARRADAALADRLDRAGQQRQRVESELRAAAGPGAIDMARLVEAQLYVSVLQALEADLRQERQTLAAEIDRRRQTLVKADQDVKALEKLRQRRLECHRRHEERREAQQLDEVALHAAAS